MIAVTSSPNEVAGPQGPTGAQGASGAQGVQGVPGPQGPQAPRRNGIAGTGWTAGSYWPHGEARRSWARWSGRSKRYDRREHRYVGGDRSLSRRSAGRNGRDRNGVVPAG